VCFLTGSNAKTRQTLAQAIFDLARDVAFLTLNPPARVQTCPLPSHDMYKHEHIATKILVIPAYRDEAVVVFGPTTTLAMQEKSHPSSRSKSPSLASLTETRFAAGLHSRRRQSPRNPTAQPSAPPFPSGHSPGCSASPHSVHRVRRLPLPPFQTRLGWGPLGHRFIHPDHGNSIPPDWALHRLYAI